MKRLSDLVLLPAPRTIHEAAGAFKVRPGTKDPAGVKRRREPGLPPQGYRLGITGSGIDISAADPAGFFYGMATLRQALEQSDGGLACGEIIDWPDFPARGVMLDVSRTRVPTMETLFSLIDMFAGLKLNHLQLYTEHTFAYTGHEEIWAEASPLTGEEILRLDTYCRDRFIELAPNQNSFGHMTRWLTHPRYRHLAECLDGFDWPWGGRSSEPFSLDPSDPGSLSLLEDLYAQLLPHFSSRLFNVGCDETFDVGQGKSTVMCAGRGRGRVYLDFLLKVHELVKRHGRTMMFWGDIIIEHPELVPEIPRDSVALEWGYEADHPFAVHGARFAGSGIPFWVCPGTSSWNSIAGRTDNCLGNLRGAAQAGLAHGAAGCLITDWGDNGHWQVLPVSFPGFAAGAAFSWCLQAADGLDLAAALDLHVFRDTARIMGRLSLELGNAYRRAGGRLHNASHLFQILRSPPGAALPQSVTKESLQETKAFIEATANPLDSSRMDRPDAALVRGEFANTVRLLLLACDRGLGAGEDGGGQRKETILGEYERLWLARNRPGGLRESAGKLEEALAPSPRGDGHGRVG